jgi:hypothetical protein
VNKVPVLPFYRKPPCVLQPILMCNLVRYQSPLQIIMTVWSTSFFLELAAKVPVKISLPAADYFGRLERFYLNLSLPPKSRPMFMTSTANKSKTSGFLMQQGH